MYFAHQFMFTDNDEEGDATADEYIPLEEFDEPGRDAEGGYRNMEDSTEVNLLWMFCCCAVCLVKLRSLTLS